MKKKKKQLFDIGEIVIYPKHGVGEIKSITPIEINKMKEFTKISKPDICDTLVSTENFKYRDDTKAVRHSLNKLRKSFIDLEAVKKVNDENNILEFIEEFTEINGRNPRLHELKEHFEGKVSVEMLEMVLSGLVDNGDEIIEVVENI